MLDTLFSGTAVETLDFGTTITIIISALLLGLGISLVYMYTHKNEEYTAGFTITLAELIKKDGYQLSFDYGEEVLVCADEIKITQAFYNLLINGVNYAGVDKTIIIRQIISGDKIRIEVSDNGDGIAPENLPYIWDRYYKVDKKHKRAVTGTGLGLSIVKKIIELHDGNYGVESGVGKGSTFWFDLKLV